MNTELRRPGGRFPTTHWSEVWRASDADPHVRRQAMESLLRQYLPAFRAHLERRRRIPPHSAEDLVQGFVCDQIVVADLIQQADRDRGRLRTFLQLALDRYVLQAHRRDRAAKRGGGVGPAPIADEQDHPATREPSAPEAFDLAWARQVLGRALSRMRSQCARSGRPQIWQLFRCRIVLPLFEGTASPRYQELVGRFAFDSPASASNALITAKRMFARVLRGVIGEYADADDIEQELADLMAIFSRAGSRPQMQILPDEQG